MSRSFPPPMRVQLNEKGQKRGVRAKPRTRSSEARSVDPAEVDLALIQGVVDAVPQSLLSSLKSTPVTDMDPNNLSISPLLREVIAENVLVPKARVVKKRKIVDDGTQHGKRPDRKDSDPGAVETQEKKLAMSVEKYKEDLVAWMDELKLQRNVGRTTKSIRHMLQLMMQKNKQLIPRLPVELLIQIVKLLDNQIVDARAIDICAQGQSSEDSRLIHKLNSSLDAATATLYIMTAPDIDRRVLSEEVVEHCVLLIKHIFQRLIYPAIDLATYKFLTTDDTGKVDTTKMAKAHESLRKKIEHAHLIQAAYSFLESLQELLGSLKLQDTWILQLSNVLLSAFAMDVSHTSISTVQLVALPMIRSIFVNYPSHRMLLLEEIFLIMTKLSTAKKHLRTYAVDDSDVQIIVVLIATLVQSTIVTNQVQETINTVVQMLLTKFMKKEEEVDLRLHFEHFIEDLLILLVSPEWPVAEALIAALVSGLIHLLSNQSAKPETQSTVLALTVLGKVATTIKVITCEASRSEQLLIKVLEDCHIATVPKLLVQYTYQKNSQVPQDAILFYLSRFDEGYTASLCPQDLSRDDAHMIMHHFLSTRELCKHFDAIFGCVLGYLSKGQVTFRSRVLKAIVGVVDADPSLMSNEALHKAITGCFIDEAAAVRLAAVDLVSKYISEQTSLFPQYATILKDRVRDASISVRKSVLKIMRQYILNEFDVTCELLTSCLHTLVERLADDSEDESIKEIVVGIFQDVWFGQDLPTMKNSEDQYDIVPSSVRKLKTKRTSEYGTHRVLTIMEVVHTVPQSDWFVMLIQRLLKNYREDMEKYCQSIVAGLMDLLLQVEEGNTLPNLTFRMPEQQIVATLKTLHVFCKAIPELLLPYKETLIVYLKHDGRLSKPIQAQVFALASSMIGLIFPFMEKLSESWIQKLEFDLKVLVFQAPPSVVKPSVECLAKLIQYSSAKRAPTILFQMLVGFYSFLTKIEPILKSAVPSIPVTMQANLQRALFATGLITGALDWDQYEVNTNSSLKPGKIVNMVYDIYHAYISIPQKNDAFTTAFRVKTVQGLGFIFHRHPRWFLKAQEDGVLTQILAYPTPEVRCQLIMSLSELLRAEEARLESGEKIKRKNIDQVQGDQEGDASLIGGVMQAQLSNILKTALQKEDPIRIQSMACIALLIIQGLVSPIECIPTLIALETDQIPVVREGAHHQLVAIHEKFPNIVNTCTHHGIELSFEFQLRVFKQLSVVDMEKMSLYGPMYNACIQPSRVQRNSFFNTTLGLIKEKSSVFQEMANKSLSREQGLAYLSYVVSILASLPYEVEDEPLFIIHGINREISLSLAGVCNAVKKRFPKQEVDRKWIISSKVQFPTSLAAKSDQAFALALLLHLKQHLKQLYQLDNEKCQTYQPLHSSKAQAQSVLRGLLGTLDFDVPAISPAFTNGWASFTYLWPMVLHEQQQIDFDIHTPKPRKRKTK
ncbi:nipped-B [Thraustotheca clavata]|uniref:Sister chromatid cohesion protein n=1 Tax=Thraustotheca clavata TaxID=74557 RepID=A0A1W0A426_9STRA|nr:nipped-B [Thraustotheca clavata]